MVEDQVTRLSALRERVIRGEYEVDSRAVAEAIVRRVHDRALAWAPLQRVLVAREDAGRIREVEFWRAF
jgi:hypothetical protein